MGEIGIGLIGIHAEGYNSSPFHTVKALRIVG